MNHQITDDLQVLLDVLPEDVKRTVVAAGRSDDLLEVILDLGRIPTARFVDREVVLLEREVTLEDIAWVVERIGDFDADNRAGIERTLHRISAIRNRRGHVVGLTCRVGRAVYGTVEIVQDIVESGQNVLLLGRPGVGKTTLLREAARILAEQKRVVIVDTSNEIGGDGDVAHPAVGRARRMQVAQPSLQHEVMIEAVENHNPEVIIIDEIGREQEAAAARTIAERGVQLIGTAHGNTLDNILLNPTLADLVGGIEAVTLSDEEARRRGTQKTVLERRAPPTFDVLIEIQERERLALHHDVSMAVDSLLRGGPLTPELRYRDRDGQIKKEVAPAPPAGPPRGKVPEIRSRRRSAPMPAAGEGDALPYSPTPPHMPGQPLQTIRVYPFGVARNRLEQAARRMRLPVQVVKDAGQAQAMVTLKSHYRKRQRAVSDAENAGLPIYVLRANTTEQMESFLSDLFNLPAQMPRASTELDRAVYETRQAIEAVRNGARSVDLPPVSSYIRRIQHQMARQANLVSHSYGKEPRRRVRIFRD